MLNKSTGNFNSSAYNRQLSIKDKLNKTGFGKIQLNKSMLIG